MVLILCAFLCAFRIAESAQERKEILSDAVDYVEMKQNGKELRLSRHQTQELTKRWNQARPIGLCKFYAKYIITVYAKNGETRTFRATSDTLKEDDDYCFVAEDSYIGTLWKSNR